MKKPANRAAMCLEHALNSLHEMERTFAEPESSDVFQAFTAKETAQYRNALDRLRYLIRELEHESAQAVYYLPN